MKNGLLLVGAAAAGISAFYLMDQKRGPKRRKLLKKKADHLLKEASHKWKDYSEELRPYWNQYSTELASGAERFTKGGLHTVEQATRSGWAPSARTFGAVASAVAFYGAGRKGMFGMLLRIVSLGLFTRALLATK